jgi:hypothetical protein
MGAVTSMPTYEELIKIASPEAAPLRGLDATPTYEDLIALEKVVVAAEAEPSKQDGIVASGINAVTEVGSDLKDYGIDFVTTARSNANARVNNFLKNVGRAGDPKDLYSVASLPNSVLQEVAGGVLDAGGQVFQSVLDGISVAIPDGLGEDGKQKFLQAWNVILNTESGQRGIEAYNKGINFWKKFELDNPNAAQSISAGINVASLLAPVKAKKTKINIDASPSPLQILATKMDDAAGNQVKNKREKRAIQLLSPNNLKDAFKVEENGFNTRIPVLDPYDKKVVERMGKLEFNPTHSSIKVRDTVYRQAELERQQLEESLTKQPHAPIDNAQVMAGLKTKIDDLIENNAEAQTLGFDRLSPMFMKKTQELLDKNANTPIGILNARRELDEWAKSMKGNKAFDVDGVRAGFKSLLDTSRKHLNDEIAISSPSSNVKKSLESQSLLLSAGSSLDDKVRSEAATVIGRVIQNIKNTTGLSIPTTPLSVVGTGSIALTTVGGLGVAQAIGVASSVYLAGSMAWKTAVSPKTKKILALTIRNLDKSIKVVQTGSGYAVGTLAQMRADRAYLQDLLQSFPTSSSSSTEETEEKVVGEGEALKPNPPL